jgi:hypothetical protein
MTPKEKAENLIDKFKVWKEIGLAEYGYDISSAKEHALIAVEIEYTSLRELVFLFKANGIIEKDKVYLFWIQHLVDEENKIKQEIEKL